MKKGNALLYVILILLLTITGGVFYLFKTKYNVNISPVSDSPTPVASASLAPLSPSPSANNWGTYKNKEYGFELSFPPDYLVLTDDKNLYGWPDALALMYKGGQSYDLAIEYWDSQEEYEDKYNSHDNLTVKKVENGYVTFLNTNNDPTVDEIISTYKNTSE